MFQATNLHELVGRVQFAIFEKFTSAYQYQIALELMLLPILIIYIKKSRVSDWLKTCEIFV